MKLAETTIDDEKENNCNGNGISEQAIVKKPLQSEPSNGDLNDDSGSTDLGVGDLLVEDPNASRHDCEEGNQFGSRADDSTSISSSSSNLVNMDFQQDLSDEEIHLRLSDEDEPSSNGFFTSSSPLPKAEEDKNKTEEKAVSVPEEKSVSDNNKSECEISEPSEDKNSSSEKSDDLENLISDLNEQSKSALKSESVNVTISDLRQEIEDFIKNHDDSELQSKHETNQSTSQTDSKLECENKKNMSDESITIDEHEIEMPKNTANKSEPNENTSDDISKESDSKLCETTDKKQCETVDTDKTSATNVTEINKPETKEIDNSECQKINNSEKIETESSYHTETPETETSNEIDKPQVNNSNSEGNGIEKDGNLKLMEVDLNESEILILDNNEKSTILIDDDVEMKEDFSESHKEKSKHELGNEKLVEIKTEDVEKVQEIKKDLLEDVKEEAKDVQEEKCSLKRSLENNEDLKEVKKPKINGVVEINDKPKQYIRLDSFKEFMSKKEISSLTRAELEQFCLQKMCEAITQTSKIAELNRKVIQQETMIENLRTKTGSIHKQIKDLEVVHSRVFQEIKTKKKEGSCDVTPVKITRSVGLQVSLQPIPGRIRPPAIVVPDINVPLPVKRKVQRNNLPNKILSPQTSMPPPKPPVQRSPSQTKTIKTILPKVYTPDPQKDPSLLESYLQTPSTSKTSPSPPRKSAGPTPSTSNDAVTKVIDLTEEDDSQKASGSSASGNIRVVAPQQLQTSVATSSTVPRLTYLVQGNQNGQQVLLATTSTNTRPGQVRPTMMFKPVAPGQVTPGQRLNIVRPTSVTGITVLPTTTAPTIRGGQIRFASPVPGTRPQVRAPPPARHPAPLPGPPAVQPSQPNWKAMPPRPTLKISRVGDGIVLSWRMQTNKDMSLYEDIGSYQLYAYQETNGPPSTDMWRKVGDVKALALPMACTLTQFTDGNKYHFAVRAVDVKSRVGPFSHPEQIALP